MSEKPSLHVELANGLHLTVRQVYSWISGRRLGIVGMNVIDGDLVDESQPQSTRVLVAAGYVRVLALLTYST